MSGSFIFMPLKSSSSPGRSSKSLVRPAGPTDLIAFGPREIVGRGILLNRDARLPFVAPKPSAKPQPGLPI